MSGPFGSSQWMYNAGGAFYGTEIDNSLRFNDDDSAYLTRTPASSGTTGTWTLSVWVKRANLTNGVIFSSGAVNQRGHVWLSDNQLHVQPFNSTGANAYLVSDMLFRDVGAWYHIVVKANAITYSNLSTNMDIYVNGVEITHTKSQTGTPSGGDRINDGQVKIIGQFAPSSGTFFDGYLAEMNFIDGTALDASNFGETKSGIWIPKAYSGSYGTNGFHLEFAGNANDTSGNGNNFTATNISAYDYVPDSPTNNFATMNSLDKSTSGAFTFSEGNLKTQAPGTNWVATRSSMFVSSGQWYWECRFNAGTMTEIMNGIADVTVANTTNIWTQAGTVLFYNHLGGEIRYNSGTQTSNDYGTFVAGDILGVALDMDAKTISFYKNGTIIVTNFSINYTNVDTVSPVGVSDYSNVIYAWNFGQDSTFAGATTAGGNTDDNGYGDFKYAPPSGFLALCSANLPAPAIDPADDASPTDYFNTVLYSGNGSTNAITGVGFGPEFCWAKSRNLANSHRLIDIVRGDSILYTDLTDAENTGGDFTFDSDGITWNGGGANANDSDKTFALWSWLAGGTASSNTDGSITSSVSANTDAGFSIVTYTGNGVTGATRGHGLGVKPDWIILKKRSATSSWLVYNSARGATKYITLPGTPSEQTSSGAWNNTEPTSSVFTTGSFGDANDSGATFVAYCFANKEGYSKVGTYIGNGSSDGTFIYTGFRPAAIIGKNINDATTNWWLHDNKRLGYNANNYALFPAISQAEDANVRIDILSNGFKIRNTAKHWNTSGQTFIYLAFAEQPFKYANAR